MGGREREERWEKERGAKAEEGREAERKVGVKVGRNIRSKNV